MIVMMMMMMMMMMNAMISHNDGDDDVYVDNNYNDNGDTTMKGLALSWKVRGFHFSLKSLQTSCESFLENSLNFLKLFFNAF